MPETKTYAIDQELWLLKYGSIYLVRVLRLPEISVSGDEYEVEYKTEGILSERFSTGWHFTSDLYPSSADARMAKALQCLKTAKGACSGLEEMLHKLWGIKEVVNIDSHKRTAKEIINAAIEEAESVFEAKDLEEQESLDKYPWMIGYIKSIAQAPRKDIR